MEGGGERGGRKRQRVVATEGQTEGQRERLHNAQDLGLGPAATEAVQCVAKAVLVKAACQPDLLWVVR